MENPPRPDEIFDPMETPTVEEYLGGAMDRAIKEKQRMERGAHFKAQQDAERALAEKRKKAQKAKAPNPVQVKPEPKPVSQPKPSVEKPVKVVPAKQTPVPPVQEKTQATEIEGYDGMATAIDVMPLPEANPIEKVQPEVIENKTEGDFEVNKKGKIVAKKKQSSTQEFYRDQGEHLKETIIAGITTFLELYGALEDFGSVVDRDSGSAKEISTEDVIDSINDIRRMDTAGREHSIKTITSALGIRDKVAELLVTEPPTLPKIASEPSTPAPEVKSAPVIVPVNTPEKPAEEIKIPEPVPPIGETSTEIGNTLDSIRAGELPRPQTREVLESLIFAEDDKEEGTDEVRAPKVESVPEAPTAPDERSSEERVRDLKSSIAESERAMREARAVLKKNVFADLINGENKTPKASLKTAQNKKGFFSKLFTSIFGLK